MQILLYLLDDGRAWVVALVNSVSKAVEQVLFVLDVLNELGDVLLLADALEHAQHGLVGTSVLGAVKGSGGSGNAGVKIDAAGGKVPHGCGRAVQLVLCVQDEEHLQGLDEFGVGVVLVLVHAIEHLEEVLGVGV